MSLIIATGSNIGDRIHYLETAKAILCKQFKLIKASQFYESSAMGKTDQPSFINQVIEFEIPELTPQECLEVILNIEKEMGRIRTEKWGPRIIDIDIIFWGQDKISSDYLQIPHPHWSDRSFVVRPLMELPFYQQIKNQFEIKNHFEIESKQISLKDTHL